jgi:hypothetical protein
MYKLLSKKQMDRLAVVAGLSTADLVNLNVIWSRQDSYSSLPYAGIGSHDLRFTLELLNRILHGITGEPTNA